jgi:negative regulator of sigma E activity
MFGIGLFEYQRRRYRRWSRLSPAGKAWWAVKKAITAAVVAVVLAVVVVHYNHSTAVLAVVQSGASPLTLVGPVVSSLPTILLTTVVSVLAVLWPTRSENDVHY